MSVIYHDQSNFQIPQNWKKDESLKLTQNVSEGIRYQIISKYEEHYGVLERIFRVVLGAFLSLTVVTFAFKSGREFICNAFFSSVKQIHYIRVPDGDIVDIEMSITGNPTHMGHMEMIALAVDLLENEKYQIKQVKICLSPEDYLKQKVFYCNQSIQKHSEDTSQMLKVLLPREKRVAFLRETIKQAKLDQLFKEHLKIDYFDEERRGSNHNKTFHVVGADYAIGMEVHYPHTVIISREGQDLSAFQEAHTDNYSRFIVNNPKETSTYSSSKIQSGVYELLPPAIRKEFQNLHLKAQVDPSQLQEVEKIQCPIARETGLACLQGSYTSSSGENHPLSSGKQLILQSRAVPNTLIESSVEPNYKNSTLEVVNLDCLDAAEQALNTGAKKVAVLMLASPIEPGGAMEDGNQGQEEDLCRRSDIFGFMWNQSRFLTDTNFYNLVDVNGPHQTNPDYTSMENNKMIRVPGVTVFRSKKSEGYKMLDQPFQIGMLVSPGLDRPDYGKEEGKTHYVRPQDQEQLDKLIMTQLTVAYKEGYDTVVLGAFGCGAFFNPPELVAESYKNVIDQFFNGAFRKITFAIIDDGSNGEHNPRGNFKPFQECFIPPT